MLLEAILEHNNKFVEEKGYEKYMTTKLPDKKLAIVTCIDTRLTELLLPALNLKNGDAKIIKNGGGMINDSYGDVMRSLCACVYQLGVKEVMVIGHDECGIEGVNADSMIEKMKEYNIDVAKIKELEKQGINMQDWLGGFDDLEDTVKKSVSIIKHHPLMPDSLIVHGLIINPETGKLRII